MKTSTLLAFGFGGWGLWQLYRLWTKGGPYYAAMPMPKVDLGSIDYMAGLGAKMTKAQRQAALKARQDASKAKKTSAKSKRLAGKRVQLSKTSLQKIAKALTAKFGANDVKQFLSNPSPTIFANPQTPTLIDAFAKQYVVESLSALGKAMPTGATFQLSKNYSLLIGAPSGTDVAVENIPSASSVKVESTIPASQQAPTASGLVTASGVSANAFTGSAGHGDVGITPPIVSPGAPQTSGLGPAAIASGGIAVLKAILDATPSNKSLASLAATIYGLAKDAENPALDPGDTPPYWTPDNPKISSQETKWWNIYKANGAFVVKTVMALMPYRNSSVAYKVEKKVGTGFLDTLASAVESSIGSTMKEGVLGNMDSTRQGRGSIDKAQLVRQGVMDMADLISIADTGLKLVSLVKTGSKYLDQAQGYAEQKALEMASKAVALNARHEGLLAAQDAKTVAHGILGDIRNNVEEVGNTMNWIVSEMPEAIVKSAIDDQTEKELGVRIFEDVIDLPKYKQIDNENKRLQVAAAEAKIMARQSRKVESKVASMERRFRWMDQKTPSGRIKTAMSDAVGAGAPRPRMASQPRVLRMPKASSYAGAPGPSGSVGPIGSGGVPDFAANAISAAMASIQSQINTAAGKEQMTQQAYSTLEQQIGNTVANSGFSLGMPSQNSMWAAAQQLVQGIPPSVVNQQISYEMMHPLGPTQGMISQRPIDSSAMIMPSQPSVSPYEPEDLTLPLIEYNAPSSSGGGYAPFDSGGIQANIQQPRPDFSLPYAEPTGNADMYLHGLPLRRRPKAVRLD